MIGEHVSNAKGYLTGCALCFGNPGYFFLCHEFRWSHRNEQVVENKTLNNASIAGGCRVFIVNCELSGHC